MKNADMFSENETSLDYSILGTIDNVEITIRIMQRMEKVNTRYLC